MTKEEIRQSIWSKMEERKISRFPGARGRIPNFLGSERCANQLDHLPAWKKARVIKSNPDSPQRQIRYKALKEGKIVYMAVPRLADQKPFIELDPARLAHNSIYKASSIRGAFDAGRPIELEEMQKIDLIVCGSVAVNREGYRIGKGEGYSELEFALCKESGKVTNRTTILTSVHPVQIVESKISAEPFDFTVDYIITADQIFECSTKRKRPSGILWKYLSPEKIQSIPALQKLKSRGTAARKRT
jgi:5-formyltetrahydrofolate cyclo-ligase